MPIDASMYQNQQAPDILGNVQQGMKMSDMLKQRERNAQADKDLAQERKMKQIDAIGSVIGNVKDQASYDATRKQLIGSGMFGEQEIPEIYDPAFVDTYARFSKTHQEQRNKERSHGIQEQQLKDNEAYRRQTLGIDRAKIEVDKAKADKEKAPTADQQKAAGFAQRIQSSEKILNSLAMAGFDGTDTRTFIQKNLYNEAKPENLQKMEQAQRNFINATLRRESGAAIADSEFENARIQYFPQRGDTKDVLEQKRQNRLDVLASLNAEGAPAAGAMARHREAVNSPNPYLRTEIPKKPGGMSVPGMSTANAAADDGLDNMSDDELFKLYTKAQGGR